MNCFFPFSASDILSQRNSVRFLDHGSRGSPAYYYNSRVSLVSSFPFISTLSLSVCSLIFLGIKLEKTNKQGNRKTKFNSIDQKLTNQDHRPHWCFPLQRQRERWREHEKRKKERKKERIKVSFLVGDFSKQGMWGRNENYTAPGQRIPLQGFPQFGKGSTFGMIDTWSIKKRRNDKFLGSTSRRRRVTRNETVRYLSSELQQVLSGQTKLSIINNFDEESSKSRHWHRHFSNIRSISITSKSFVSPNNWIQAFRREFSTDD